VLEEVSAEQVAKQVLGLPAGTAGGHDGVSVGLLKVLVDGSWLRLAHPAAGACDVVAVGSGLSSADPPCWTATAWAIAELTNWGFRLGVQTTHITQADP
jgi:hypothetical protein